MVELLLKQVMDQGAKATPGIDNCGKRPGASEESVGENRVFPEKIKQTMNQDPPLEGNSTNSTYDYRDEISGSRLMRWVNGED